MKDLIKLLATTAVILENNRFGAIALVLVLWMLALLARVVCGNP